MKIFLLIILILCIFNTFGSVESKKTCTEALQRLKEFLPLYYNDGKQLEDSKKMTPQIMRQLDNEVFSVVEVLSDLCGSEDMTKVNSLAQSILNATPRCAASAGDFVIIGILGYEANRSRDGYWNGMYEFAKLCQP